MNIYVVNSTVVNDNRSPSLPVGTPWVGNIYSKNAGSVYKYLLKTPDDITGLPGVFGPVTQEQIQGAIDTDGGTLHGWVVDDVPLWMIDGVA